MIKNASWSMKEIQHAIRMRRQGVSCADIAAALGKSVGAVEGKLNHGAKTTVPKTTVKVSPPRSVGAPTPGATQEQIWRNGAPYRDLTGVICGDPAIGCSALDRKRGVAPGRDN